MAQEDTFLTQQQQKFLEYYTDPKSPTFDNALQSALKAGYKKEYAESITYKMPEWLSERVGDMRRLRKAERNMDEVLNLDIKGEDGKVDIGVLTQRNSVDRFVAKSYNRKKYGDRQEIAPVDGDGNSLPIMAITVAPWKDDDRK